MQDRFLHIGVDPQEFAQTQGRSARPSFVPVLWFADTDAISARLFAAVERRQMEEERKNAEALMKAERSHRRKYRSGTLTTLQYSGMGLILVGAVTLIFAVIMQIGSRNSDGLLLCIPGVGLLGGGIILYTLYPPTPPAALPLPEFGLWEDSLEKAWAREEQKMPLAPVMPPFQPPHGLKKLEKLRFWTQRGNEALTQCDYELALACGAECLKLQPGHGSGLLIVGVSGLCLRYSHVGDPQLSQAVTGFRKSPSVNWGVAWGSMASGNWTLAEIYLLGATERMAAHATLYGVLALAQEQRGKLRLSIENWRKALALSPDSFRLRLRLAQTLLLAGKAKDAVPEFEKISTMPQAQTEKDVPLGLTRMHLQLGRKAEADALAAQTAAAYPDPETLYRIGSYYMVTDNDDEAAQYFHQATAHALFPAAWVQLGMLHARAKRTAEARACYLGALNLLHPRVPKADAPLRVLEASLDGLRDLRSPVYPLLAWDITLGREQNASVRVQPIGVSGACVQTAGRLWIMSTRFTAPCIRAAFCSISFC